MSLSLGAPHSDWQVSEPRVTARGEVILDCQRRNPDATLEVVVEPRGYRRALVEGPLGALSYRASTGVDGNRAQALAQALARDVLDGPSALARSFPHLAIPAPPTPAPVALVRELLGEAERPAPLGAVALRRDPLVALLFGPEAAAPKLLGFTLAQASDGPREGRVTLRFRGEGGDTHGLSIGDARSGGAAFGRAGPLAVFVEEGAGASTGARSLPSDLARLASTLVARLAVRVCENATVDEAPPAAAPPSRAEALDVPALLGKLPSPPGLGARRGRALEDCVAPAVLASLRLGVRKTGIVTLPEDCDWVAARAEFERVVVLRRVEGKAADASNLVDATGGEGRAFTLLSHEEALPLDAELALNWGRLRRGRDDEGPNRFFGKLLGYPECCIEAFAQYLDPPEIGAVGEPPAEHNLSFFRRTRGPSVGPYSPLLNHFLVDRFQLLFHFPCRYDCQASLAGARSFCAAIEAIDAPFAARLRALLAGLTLVFGNDDYLHLDVDSVEAIEGGCEAQVRDVKLASLRSSAHAAWVELARPGARLQVTERFARARLPGGDVRDAVGGDLPLPFWFSEAG